MSDDGKVMLDEPEAQSDLDRVLSWLNSDLLLHRLYLVRDLSEHAKKIGFEDSEKHLVPVLDKLGHEEEQALRQAVAEQLPAFAGYLKQASDRGYDLISSSLVPLLPGLLADDVAQVREHAQVAVPEIAKLLKVEDVTRFVIPMVERLASGYAAEEEQRVTAAELINALSAVIPREVTLQHLVPLLITLSTDNMFRVRKAVAASLEGFTQNVGPELTCTKLLPLLLELSTDEIWGVRKACADSIVAVSKYLSDEQRVKELVPLMQRLVNPSNESSRWVRTSAYQALGPFIATFPPKQVPAPLVEIFTNMAKFDKESEFGDSEYVQFCAFSFPAVLLTMGAENWASLSETFATLGKDFQWKTRRTLSFSLHEIARILGPKLTEEELLPTFDLFLHDLDEVKLGVISHFADFLESVSAVKRKDFLPFIEEVHHSPGNWRFRKLVARQLGKLALLFDVDTVVKDLVPLALAVLVDGVAAVRKNARIGLAALIKSLESVSDRQVDFLEKLANLAKETTYQKRLTFGQVAPLLKDSLPPALYEKYLLEPLLALVQDKVPNVRISVAKSLMDLSKSEVFANDLRIKEALSLLEQDKDRDVARSASTSPSPSTSSSSPASS